MRLHCHTREDILLLSTLCQDAVYQPGWYSLDNQVLKIFLRRYCWENPEESLRRNSILTFHFVNNKSIFTKKWRKFKFLSLHCILVNNQENLLHLLMSQDVTVAIKINHIDIILEDISTSYSANKTI